MIFKIADGTLSDIAAMDIWQEKLEISVALINDDAMILGASLVVKYLDIISVVLGFEARHDDVVVSNTMQVVF